mgnify:CR=1 FL=1
MAKEFEETLERIAVKYANLVEKHIDEVKENNLAVVYDDIRLLGNIASAINRSSSIGDKN